MNEPAGLVIDASVAVKWHLPDENLVAQAGILLENYTRGRLALTAPSFIRYEVAQSLLCAARGARVSLDYTHAAFRRFLGFGLHLPADGDALIIAAQRIAGTIGGSLYDALYVAHAEATGYALVTDDRALLQRASGQSVPVHPLADIRDLL